MLDYNIRNGRTYMYFKEEPLYPFGYGLSFSRFVYSNLKLSKQEAGRGESITVSTDILNAGEADGDEVVQLYVQYPGSIVQRPLKELKGFKRVHIKAGETTRVEILLDMDELSYWNADKGSYELEKGEVNLFIGASSADIRLKTSMTVL